VAARVPEGGARGFRPLAGAFAAAAAILAGCGGGASVGDCIDGNGRVVNCSSSAATQKLVSKQSGSKAIACVQIGDKPQTQVKVGGDTFCAEPK
jgi:hypothetical protein